MSTVNRIREALRNGQVVLDRGAMRIAGEAPPKASSSGHLSTVPSTQRSAPPGATRPGGVIEAEFNDEPAELQLKPTTWGAPDEWYVRPRFEKRIAMEVDLLRAQFPEARLTVMADKQLAWNLRVRSLTGRSYDAVLVYPASFPAGEIAAYIVRPDLETSPHQFANGHLCLGHSFARETSAVTTALWVAAWVSAYEDFQVSGSWPEFHATVNS